MSNNIEKSNKIGQHQYMYQYFIQHHGAMLHINFEIILCITYGYP